MIQQQGPIAETIHGSEIVRDEDDGPAGLSQFGNAVQAFRLEGSVSDRQDFVEQQDVGFQMCGDGEAQPDMHS